MLFWGNFITQGDHGKLQLANLSHSLTPTIVPCIQLHVDMQTHPQTRVRRCDFSSPGVRGSDPTLFVSPVRGVYPLPQNHATRNTRDPQGIPGTKHVDMLHMCGLKLHGLLLYVQQMHGIGFPEGL